MAEQKKPGSAQEALRAEIADALYQPEAYQKNAAAADVEARAAKESEAKVRKDLGLTSAPGNPMHQFDIGRAYTEGKELHAAYEAAGIPWDRLPYHNMVDLGLAIQAKEKLAKGQVAPAHETYVKRISEYVPPVPEQYAPLAERAKLAFRVAQKPAMDEWGGGTWEVHRAARESVDAKPPPSATTNLPATQRALQRIAEATPPEPKLYDALREK